MSDISLSKAVRSNLLSLQNTATMMEKTQDRLATGNKVNSALDNPSSFFTASALNSRAADMSSLLDSMASGIKVIEAANNGLTALTKNLESMQSSLRQARQDKSFQNVSLDVTDASKITLSGGQMGESKTISLADAVAKAGEKAELQTVATTAYLGPVNSTDEGIGARAVVSNKESNVAADKLASGAEFFIAGTKVTVGSTITNAGIATTAQDALEANEATKGKYKVTADGSNGFIVETIDPLAEAATVTFAAADTAKKASTTFNFTAVQGNVTVAGQTIETGSDFDSFIANLKAGEKDGGYTVTGDKETGAVTLTAAEYGATAPATSVPLPVAGTKQVDTITVTGPATGPGKITVAGIEIDYANADTAAQIGDKVRDFLTNDTSEAAVTFRANYEVAGTGDAVTITQKTPTGPVATATAVSITGSTGAGATSTITTVGVKKVEGYTNTTAVLGNSVETVAAARDEFSVTYDGKTANIAIAGVKGGLAAVPASALDIRDWKDATVASVNNQLINQGIKGVEAKFDEDGKFSIVAKSAEAKSVAVSGADANRLFGAESVKTGSPEVSELKATKTTDKFVELINREFGTAVRASNDNGKLRIENLSTQALDVGLDTNGAQTSKTVGGNDVRSNLSKQFNELRDQFDKLADDASFNGINLLRGDKLTITFNETGSSSIAIQSKDKSDNVRAITASTLGLDSLVSMDLDSDAAIDDYIAKVQSALSEIRSQASTFGSNLSSVQNRQDFTKNMINTLETGAANLTLADMNEEAANLLALQTRQSLSSSALSMASQQDQSVLQLLR